MLLEAHPRHREDDFLRLLTMACWLVDALDGGLVRVRAQA